MKNLLRYLITGILSFLLVACGLGGPSKKLIDDNYVGSKSQSKLFTIEEFESTFDVTKYPALYNPYEGWNNNRVDTITINYWEMKKLIESNTEKSKVIPTKSYTGENSIDVYRSYYYRATVDYSVVKKIIKKGNATIIIKPASFTVANYVVTYNKKYKVSYIEEFRRWDEPYYQYLYFKKNPENKWVFEKSERKSD